METNQCAFKLCAITSACRAAQYIIKQNESMTENKIETIFEFKRQSSCRQRGMVGCWSLKCVLARDYCHWMTL